MKKIISFLKSKEKMNTVSTALYFMKQKIFYKRKFFKFGRKSLIISPISLIGASYIEIGEQVTIMKNSRIEAIDSYDGKKFLPKMKIGDNTSIGQNFHIVACDELEIGKDVTISANVYISDVEHDYQELDIHILKQNLIVKKTKIGDNCFIGYGAYAGD